MPQTYNSIGCLQRIQEFLRQEPRVERRLLNPAPVAKAPPSITEAEGIQLVERSTPATTLSHGHDITLRNCGFGWDSAPRPVLNTTIKHGPSGWLAMVIGPVGCGKSTFLKALIGETARLDGELRLLASKVAFCDQTTWITNGTIRANVIGQSPHDEEWYTSVIRACDLQTDLDQLSRGDQTVVGSKGIKLSGGQKQRIVRLGPDFLEIVLTDARPLREQCTLALR
jgi:ATP-binding cassette, subfamily C (CFTR/MRP), member 1